ncbi:MAG: Gram-negative bacterial TonB protein C-terminal [Verrucomicrobiota bacterium]
MRPAPVQPDSDRLLDFVVVALAVVALGVSVSGLTRTPPRLEPATLPPAKAKPALVRLDPTKLRTAPSANADSAAVAPDAALAPAPLAPISSLPDVRLPSLPQVPAVTLSRTVTTPTVPSVGKTGSSRGGATAGPIVLDVAEMAGRQPWPEYPYECLRRRESGVVRVEFEVGENGAVRRARAVNTSGCHRLDEAATDTILRRWEFPAGDVRLYEISIHFQLQ